MALHATLAHLCRDRRTRLGLTQRDLARRIGVDRSYIAKVEHGVANPTLDLAERIIQALGLEVELLVEQPLIIGERRSTDRVHAWCSGYIDRRLGAAGWATAREVEIGGGPSGRASGWIDLLAFDPRTATLLIVEVKTRLDDLGGVERRLAWYERHAIAAAARYGWRPRRIVACLLLLHTDEVERSLVGWGDAVKRAFVADADALASLVSADPAGPIASGGRALALIDPTRRGRRWLVRPRVAGGRTPPPYVDYGDAAARMAGGRGAASRADRSCRPGTPLARARRGQRRG